MHEGFKTKLALTASMLLCLSAPIGLPPTRAAAQNRPQNATVGGTVTDESGEAIIGASIVVDGSGATIGTVTDINGKFSLNVKPGTMLPNILCRLCHHDRRGAPGDGYHAEGKRQRASRG